jgi:alanyl-tRNA synthetase
MTAHEIRRSFLDFFAARGHRIVPSAPVIPHGDPTLLFTNAGMNQFKDVFLGLGTRDYRRAADTQKCIRVSGKHNDLEEVGRDTYHHTFFEMLGNWSFGDYYKREAISWAWELLTGVWGLDRNRLHATVFETDDEADGCWRELTDIDPGHIHRFGKKDNFWEMGDTGPCGPCSEIHYDRTEDRSGAGLVNAGDPRVMEIWNLVFIQNNRIDEHTLEDLPANHVDTGMGFERICAVVQGTSSNYETDVFTPILEAIGQATGRRYEGEETRIAMRVIADHIRMLSFAIADGALPGNDGRGYVLRRILRRASRFGRTLGMHDPFLHRLAATVADTMGDVFPEVRQHRSHIERVIQAEEESFGETLDRGLEIFTSAVERIGHSRVFPGADAFKLYDTYGFPLDLTQLMAAERGLQVDVGEFTGLMEEQRRRARESARSEAHTPPPEILSRLAQAPESSFVGWDRVETTATVSRVLDDRFIALDRTPFYVEAGGQVDDTGVITGEHFRAEVIDSFRQDLRIIHEIRVVEGDAASLAGRSVRALVDRERRNAIERNHSATHLVHEALRRVLGSHLHQQGSLVAPDRLRFDFNHFSRITPEELRAIEDMVNAKISEKVPVHALNDPRDWLTIEEARRRYPNVKMFFADKYGDRVRIVEIDPGFSVELCGGTHVRRTDAIGLFKIVSESGIASGIRRIEAVTGEGVRKYVDEQVRKIGSLDDQIGKLLEEVRTLERQTGVVAEPPPTRPAPLSIPSGSPSTFTLSAVEEGLRSREEALQQALRTASELRKAASRSRVRTAASAIDEILAGATRVDGITVAAGKIDAGSLEELKSLADSLRTRLRSGVGVLGAALEGKAALVCVVTDDLIAATTLKAGSLVGALAKIVGGGGGGKPHLATAGGKNLGKLDDALRQAPSVVGAHLAR